ncbi:Ig-like domain-containing protein, partial [Verrucomicrobia bacterium]|nr:Ig-like domain-containing protein [Verrucomicrobiota bacterium]
VENIDDDPPVAREDLIDVPEDAVNQVLRVLEDNGSGADYDPEGGELRIVDIEPIEEAGGTSSIAENGKSILYSPISDFVGTDSFRYTVTDGTLESVAILTVHVTNNDNDPPVARDDQFFALEDEGVLELKVLENNGNGPDFDPEGDPLTITSVPTETEGSTSISLNENRTVILYTSSSDFFGADQFSYSISDGTNVADAMVTVLVTRGDNDAPITRDDAFIVSEDSIENRFDVLADNGSGSDSDPDDDTIRIVAVHGPASEGGMVRLGPDGDKVEYIPSPDFHGDETFSYTISDGFLTSTGTVMVSVTPIPDPPLIARLSDVLIDQGDGVYSLAVVVEDVDSDEEFLQLEMISDNEILLPSNRIEFERTAEGWRVELTPVLGEAGVALVSVKVSDETLSSSQSFRFVVAETVGFSGITAGGFLGGGVVFVDSNRDGRQGLDEPGSEIQRDGSFQFSARLIDVDSNQDGQLSFADGDLVVNEGFDLWSGSPLSIQMRAPLDEQIISPLSSLVSAVLDSGAAQTLEEAAERVARMLGLNHNGENVLSVLRLDLEGTLDSGNDASRTLLSRMAWLHSMIAQATHLVAGLTDKSPSVVSRELFLFLAQRDARVYSDCSVVEELVRETAARFDVGVQPDVLAFSLKIICQHLDRIDAALHVVDSESNLGETLGSLHLFSDFEIDRQLSLLASMNDVPDHLLFRFLPSQVEERLKDYPLSSLLELRQSPGQLRFLHDTVSVVEDGRNGSHVALVREGGSFGSLDATMLIVGETAEASQDFVLRPLVVQFSDGELIREIDLSELLLDDELVEGGEVAEIRLFYGDETDEAGIAFLRDRSRLELIDDESVGVFEFSQEAFSIKEDLMEKAVFVSRRGGQKSRASFDVTLLESGGVVPAEVGGDFSGEPISVVFEEGETVKGIRVPVIGDFRVEKDETVILELSAAKGDVSGGQVGGRRRSVLTILNDDFDQEPTIETIPAQILQEDQSLTVAFSIGDDSTPLNELVVDAFSNDLSLVVVERLELNPLTTRFSLLLRPMPNAHGEADVEVQVSDRFQTKVVSFLVSVSPINDPPEIEVPTENRVLYIEDEPPVALVPRLTINDVDNDGLIGAIVEFTEGFRSGEDRLIFGQGGGGIVGAYDRGRGVMELRGVASVEEYQGALRRVLYDNRSENPNSLSRVLTVRVRDEGLESQAIKAIVTVEAVNDPPLLARVEADPLVYVEGDTPVPLSESILVATLDDLIFTEAIVKISENYQRDEDALVVGELPVGLMAGDFDVEMGVLSITGEGNLTDYQTALRSVSYVNLSNQPNLLVRGVEFLIRDLDLLSESKFREVRIVPVNDPPVVGVPPDFEMVSGDKGTIRLTVVDPDSEISLPVVSVGSSNPSLIPSSSVKISRDEDGLVLRFETRPDQFGEAEFMLTVTDGIDTVVRSILVTVLSKTFAPVVSGPTQVRVQEDERINISLKITDSDNVIEDLTVQYQMDNRTLFPLGSVMLARELGDVEISLLPLVDGFGEAILTVFVADGEQTTEHQIEISVISENDLPTVSGLKNFTVNPGSVIEIKLLLEDVETPIDQLLFGVRALDPRQGELLSFEIEGRGEARLVRLILDDALRETVPFQLVLIDSDGGISRYPFSVFVRDGDLGSSTLRIAVLEGGSVELQWEGVGRLTIAREMDGPFLVIPDASSPFQLRSTQAREFFKLVD